MADEAKLRRAILLALGGRDDITLFNCPTGQAWQGTVLSRRGGLLTLAEPRWLSFGLVAGGCDLIGWKTTPEGVARFLAIEVKDPEQGRIRKEQQNFIDRLRADGGIAGVADSVAGARALVETEGD